MSMSFEKSGIFLTITKGYLIQLKLIRKIDDNHSHLYLNFASIAAIQNSSAVTALISMIIN